MFSIYNNAWLTFELVKLFSLIIFFVYDLQISQNQHNVSAAVVLLSVLLQKAPG